MNGVLCFRLAYGLDPKNSDHRTPQRLESGGARSEELARIARRRPQVVWKKTQTIGNTVT